MVADTDSSLPVIFLMGPTASGKTSLAVELHRKFPIEIVSVDSAMVYKGMDIGTAKPSQDILAEAPHRLIDICDPVESYSAGRFRDDALTAIKEVHANDKIPLLVGGTGLYFRALEQGISELPSADKSIRAKLDNEAKQNGWQAMHERLVTVDPKSAKRIHPNDPQRIQRALEVYEITGKPLTSFFADDTKSAFPYKLMKIIIAPEERTVIHERVEQRFMQMIDEGLIDEVKSFFNRGDLDASLPSMRLVGYRQVWQYLEEDISYEEMLKLAVVATRQLAKRQMTWLRSEQNVQWFDSSNLNIFSNILKFLSKDSNFFVRV